MISFNVNKLDNEKNINSVSKYFKQININDKIKLLNSYIDKKYIKIHSALLNIESLKLIDTVEGKSYEGQCLSGKKLIIIGTIDITFYIKINCRTFKIKKTIPFSNFIVISKDTKDTNDIKLNYYIEDITLINIECNFLFISITIFLEYLKESSHKLLSN